MARDLRLACVILIVSGGVGLASNYLRDQPLSLIWEEPDDSQVTIDQVAAHLAAGTAFFLDARERREYAEGHLRGAINVPSSAIFEHADTVMSMVGIDQPVIVYCGGGECEASDNVASAFVRYYGYTNVSIYRKGWEEASMSDALAEFIVVDEP